MDTRIRGFDERDYFFPMRNHFQPAVYILASQRNGTLYIGVTSNLVQRVAHHKAHAVDGFTRAHKVTQLVYFELAETMDAAITREKQLKHWQRAWKISLIEEKNPDWRDLYAQII